MKTIYVVNKKNIENYIEIFVKSPIIEVKKFSNKQIYKQKYIQNVVGLDIKPEFPQSPHITIKNNFDKSINTLAKELIKKIDQFI
jgi:adenylylsulfate kinase-like enzyme|tara:strand:- start:272 stop:526 length:255 start_codon:yes stop_codon:yes gene_type:complete